MANGPTCRLWHDMARSISPPSVFAICCVPPTGARRRCCGGSPTRLCRRFPIRGRSPISGGQPCAQEYARATAAGGPADTPQSAPSRMGASTLAPSARIAVSFLSTLHLLCVDKAIREAIRLHRPQGEHKQRVACDHCHELSERSQTKLSRAV
jgi:hypothetical protein